MPAQVRHQVAGQHRPVAQRVVGDVGLPRLDRRGQGHGLPVATGTSQVQRPLAVVSFDVDGPLRTKKRQVVRIKPVLQARVLEQRRHAGGTGRARGRAGDLGQHGVRPVRVAIGPGKPRVIGRRRGKVAAGAEVVHALDHRGAVQVAAG